MYDFEIQYRLRLDDMAADTLFWRTEESHVMDMAVDWESLREESARDEELSRIRADLLKDSANHPGYYIEG